MKTIRRAVSLFVNPDGCVFKGAGILPEVRIRLLNVKVTHAR